MSGRAWSCRMLKNEGGDINTLIFAGPDGLVRSEVKRGRVASDILNGLLGLAGGRAASYVRAMFTMYTPHKDPTFLRLIGGVHSLELRFRAKPPASLLMDLRDVFCRHIPPGTTRVSSAAAATEASVVAAKENPKPKTEPEVLKAADKKRRTARRRLNKKAKNLAELEKGKAIRAKWQQFQQSKGASNEQRQQSG